MPLVGAERGHTVETSGHGRGASEEQVIEDAKEEEEEEEEEEEDGRDENEEEWKQECTVSASAWAEATRKTANAHLDVALHSPRKDTGRGEGGGDSLGVGGLRDPGGARPQGGGIGEQGMVLDGDGECRCQVSVCVCVGYVSLTGIRVCMHARARVHMYVSSSFTTLMHVS